MPSLDRLEALFVVSAFLFQTVLITHFALRKWRFVLAMRYGWVVYALSLPAFAVSGMLLIAGQPWPFWIGGLVYLCWAAWGYAVEYLRQIQWRNPPRWPIFIPYVFLYLATVMLYWWPLALIAKPLWYAYTLLFVISTVLNVTSHKGSPDHRVSASP